MERTPTPAAVGGQTTAHRLADVVLGDEGPLEAFVSVRRAQNRSWRLIAQDLYEATDREINLTYQTLRSWFPDTDSSQAAS